jgi:hypothetical protein
MKQQPKPPRFAVVANPDAPSPQELVSYAPIDAAIATLTRARRGRWPMAQIVEVQRLEVPSHG